MEAVESPIDPRDLTREILNAGQEVLLTTAGLSMGYSIRGGEAIVVRAVPAAEVRFGDIIVFQRAGLFVCHRVVRVRTAPQGRVFLTKGDPVISFDEAVEARDVLGKVVRIKWPEGDFRTESPRGRLLNTALACLSLLAAGLYRFFPLKGILKRGERGWAVNLLYRLLAFPSRTARKLAR